MSWRISVRTTWTSPLRPATITNCAWTGVDVGWLDCTVASKTKNSCCVWDHHLFHARSKLGSPQEQRDFEVASVSVARRLWCMLQALDVFNGKLQSCSNCCTDNLHHVRQDYVQPRVVTITQNVPMCLCSFVASSCSGAADHDARWRRTGRHLQSHPQQTHIRYRTQDGPCLSTLSPCLYESTREAYALLYTEMRQFILLPQKLNSFFCSVAVIISYP